MKDEIEMLEINLRRTERELSSAKMTLRDQFAIGAMQAITSWDREFSWEEIAELAYSMADAMMEARNVT